MTESAVIAAVFIPRQAYGLRASARGGCGTLRATMISIAASFSRQAAGLRDPAM